MSDCDVSVKPDGSAVIGNAGDSTGAAAATSAAAPRPADVPTGAAALPPNAFQQCGGVQVRAVTQSDRDEEALDPNPSGTNFA